MHVHTFYCFISNGTVLAAYCANIKEFDQTVFEMWYFYWKLGVSGLEMINSRVMLLI